MLPALAQRKGRPLSNLKLPFVYHVVEREPIVFFYASLFFISCFFFFFLKKKKKKKTKKK